MSQEEAFALEKVKLWRLEPKDYGTALCSLVSVDLNTSSISKQNIHVFRAEPESFKFRDAESLITIKTNRSTPPAECTEQQFCAIFDVPFLTFSLNCAEPRELLGKRFLECPQDLKSIIFDSVAFSVSAYGTSGLNELESSSFIDSALQRLVVHFQKLTGVGSAFLRLRRNTSVAMSQDLQSVGLSKTDVMDMVIGRAMQGRSDFRHFLVVENKLDKFDQRIRQLGCYLKSVQAAESKQMPLYGICCTGKDWTLLKLADKKLMRSTEHSFIKGAKNLEQQSGANLLFDILYSIFHQELITAENPGNGTSKKRGVKASKESEKFANKRKKQNASEDTSEKQKQSKKTSKRKRRN